MIALAYTLLWLALLSHIVWEGGGGIWRGRLRTGLVVLCLASLTLGLVQRGLAGGHWPLTNRYEFALCFTWAILVIQLLLEVGWGETRGTPFILAIALAIATYAVTRPQVDKEILPLLPALRSVWLQLHVLTTLLSYASFAVAAGLGLAYLVSRIPPERGGSGLLPSQGVEQAMERVVALGFPWLTLGILTGAIWAHIAWGRYWGWDPKETWALITWLWYLLVLHARTLRAWRGKRLAMLVVVGLGVVLFTYWGVPWLVRQVRLESLHGF